MSESEAKRRAALTAKVEKEETDKLAIRIGLEGLVADPAKRASRKRDANLIRAYRGLTSKLDPPCFENMEVERAFDALLATFRAGLDTLEGTL